MLKSVILPPYVSSILQKQNSIICPLNSARSYFHDTSTPELIFQFPQVVSGPLVLQTEDFAKIHDITLLSILLFFKCHYLWDYLYCCYNCNFKYLNLSSMFNPMSSGIFSFLFLAALLFLPPFLSSTSTPHPW